MTKGRLKWLKILAAVLGVLVVVAVIGAAIIASKFDPNDYKAELSAMVKEKTGRTLTLEGPLSLTFFPSLGIAMGRVQLSEPRGTKVFASLAEARVSLAVLPLLSRRVVVDRVVLSGLNADLVRAKDGRLNIDDLIDRRAEQRADRAGKGDSPELPVSLDIGSVDIQADSLGWRDEREGTQLRLAGVKLKTGRIADATPGKLDFAAHIEGTKPKLNLLVAASTGYRFDMASKAVTLSDLSAKIEGDAPGAAGLRATLKGDIESDPGNGLLRLSGVELSAATRDGTDARLSVPKLSISKQSAESTDAKGTIKIRHDGLSLDAKLALAALSARPGDGKSGMLVSFPGLDIEFSGKQGDLKLEGKFGTPVTVDPAAKTLQFPKLVGELTASGPAVPQKSLRIAFDGQVAADWGKQTASGNLAAKLDESTLQARFGATDFSPATINFDVTADRLNVDRYMAPKKPAQAADVPIDLSILSALNLNGQVRVGQLVASNVKLEKLQATIRAAKGRLDLNPVSAGLYGGTLAGSASAEGATGNVFSVKQQLSGVNIGPLLRDLADKDMLEGRGNVVLDIRTAGTTVAALKRGLNGSASVNMKDGAIKGINLAESFRKARAMLGAKSQEQAANRADKTDFTELSGSFVIRNGVAHNDDLSAKSPFLRLGGAGDIDIGAEKVNYLAKVSVVNTSGGQGSQELAALRGLTVPVHLSGPFDALKYRIDFGAVATEAVKERVQDKVKEQLQGPLQNRLKDLFKR